MFILKMFLIIFAVLVAVSLVKTVEFFNSLPEKANGKTVVAWDALILFVSLIAVIAVLAFI